MIEHSQSIAALCTALHAAQGVLTGVVKDAKNLHFKNRYASLEAVLDTARPALQANGLSVTQAPGAMVDGCVEITTMLMHTSGEWMRSTVHMPVVKRDPQGVGSALTYGMRYSLMAALGVPPTDDDDGERAMPDRGASSAPAKLHTNGKPIQLSRSQQTAQEMSAALWNISGPKVDRWLGLDAVKRDLETLDHNDRLAVETLAEERRGMQ